MSDEEYDLGVEHSPLKSTTDRLLRALAMAAALLLTVIGCRSNESTNSESDLAVVATAPSVNLSEMPTVDVQANGHVLLNNQRVSIDDLLEALEDHMPRDPICLRVQRDVSWMHAQWVLAAFAEADVCTVYCLVRVRGKNRNGVLPFRLNFGIWNFPPESIDEPTELKTTETVLVSIHRQDGNSRFALGQEAEPGDATLSDVRAWAKTRFRAIDEKGLGNGMIEASGMASFQEVADVASALLEAGFPFVDCGLESLHPWDRRRMVLPKSPHADPVIRDAYGSLWYYRVIPANLPVASFAEEDKNADDHDRVIITLTANGKVMWKNEVVSLRRVAEILEEQKQLYRKKRRRSGKQGTEKTKDGKEWTKLFALVQADQNAPAQHVYWLLGELTAAGFYKLQVGVRKAPGKELSTKQLARYWGGQGVIRVRADRPYKLFCFAVRPIERAAARFFDIGVGPKTGTFSTPQHAALGVEQLAELAREARKHNSTRTLVGRIESKPETPWGQVVLAVNALAAAEFGSVEFKDTALAPESMRNTHPLPAVKSDR